MNDLTEKCITFVNQSPDIHEHPFSKDMLQQLAACGLLGWMIPVSYGGQGKTAVDMIQAGESLMMHCENIGLVLSWVIHEIVTTWFIYGFGNEDQKHAYLPLLIKGQMLGSIAISEPDGGPHPKLLKTTAVRTDQGIQLNGEKTYLTNGPIADMYVVIAISTIRNHRKYYSAYIVPKDAPGLKRSQPLQFPFVQTSPHGGILMNHCQVPGTHLLGEENTAYDCMVKPFREIEDTLMMGPILGGMNCQLNRTIDHINESGLSLNNEQCSILGNLNTHMMTARVIAHKAAQLMDDNHPSMEFVSLLLGFRQWAGSFQNEHARLSTQLSLSSNAHLSRLTKDLCGLGKVALKIMLHKQMNIGKNLLRNT
ncbi:MAG: acyl-CoA dehydrogenase family protein [Candidatus Magnetomorum sp.]|nr:acyl-CoA dehydrogenase family protein [Candidatus Magnetomorum sp.]